MRVKRLRALKGAKELRGDRALGLVSPLVEEGGVAKRGCGRRGARKGAREEQGLRGQHKPQRHAPQGTSGARHPLTYAAGLP